MVLLQYIACYALKFLFSPYHISVLVPSISIIRPQLFFMLNSTEHEISTAH